MPKISGFVYYDPTFASAAGTGIPSVPVALFNAISGKGVVALTNVAGAYEFTNVPAGAYSIIETWGTAGAATPVSFAGAVVMPQPPEVEPPLSAVPLIPPANANALNALSPNLLAVTVVGTDIAGQNFYDAPIGNNPLTFTGVTFVGSNLITVADNGTWGSYPAGTVINTFPATAPYSGVTTGFNYQASIIPSDGNYTVMNTRGLSRFPWWAVSDHTTGIETGRMLTVNGANPGGIIFTQNVAVLPNTQYALTAWILNLINLTSGFADPQIALKVLGSDGSQIYFQNVKPIDAKNVPIWYEQGFLFNTGAFSGITVEILSQGPAAVGNDYLIDDVKLYQVKIQNLLTIKKTATPAVIHPATVVTFTSFVTNNSSSQILSNVFFKDVLDPTLIFLANSVTVDGNPVLGADPNVGFTLGNMPPNTTHKVEFKATATAGPSPVKNISSGTYPAFTSSNGDVVLNTVLSNPVFLRRPLHDYSRPSIDLVESIALQETGLSHIINAEGEKIQAMLAVNGVTPAQLLAVNTSVQDMLDSISSLQCVMKQKLKIVKNQVVGYRTI